MKLGTWQLFAPVSMMMDYCYEQSGSKVPSDASRRWRGDTVLSHPRAYHCINVLRGQAFDDLVAGSLLVLLVLQPLFPLESFVQLVAWCQTSLNIRAQLEDFAVATATSAASAGLDTELEALLVARRRANLSMLSHPYWTTLAGLLLLSFGKRMRSHPEA